MEETRSTYKIFVTPQGLGVSKHKWVNDATIDVEKVVCENVAGNDMTLDAVVW